MSSRCNVTRFSCMAELLQVEVGTYVPGVIACSFPRKVVQSEYIPSHIQEDSDEVRDCIIIWRCFLYTVPYPNSATTFCSTCPKTPALRREVAIVFYIRTTKARLNPTFQTFQRVCRLLNKVPVSNLNNIVRLTIT